MRTTTRFKPTTTTKVIEKPELGIEVFIDEKNLTAYGYQGRAKKHTFAYRFQSQERMDDYIEQFIDNCLTAKVIKAQVKETKRQELAEAKKNVSVGDIYVASWGYSMTLVDAYQVVARTAAMVTLKPIALETVSGDAGYTGQVKPLKDQFIDSRTPEFKVRIGESLKINSSAYARKWDGKRDYYFNRMD